MVHQKLLRMRKIVLPLLVVILLTGMAVGQEESEESKATGFWELKTGVGLGRLQNLKSSQVKLRGTTIPISVYRGKISENRMYGGGLEIVAGTLTSPFNNVTDVTTSEIRVHFNYMKRLSIETSLFEAWYFGGGLELRRQSLTNELAGNNSQNSVFSNSLFAVNHFERKVRLLKKDLKLSYDFSLALLSYAKDDGSFAFSAPQTALENGEFNTQDFESGIYEHGEIVSINKFANIRSKVALHFPAKRRSSWILAYEWNLVKYSRVKNYGVANALHTISITRYIPKKQK